jgi:hypothetical protein
MARIVVAPVTRTAVPRSRPSADPTAPDQLNSAEHRPAPRIHDDAAVHLRFDAQMPVTGGLSHLGPV